MRRIAVSLTALYAARKDWDKALEWGGRFVRLQRDIFDHKLPFVSEAEQCRLLKREDDWRQALQLALERPDDEAVAAATVEWVLNCKAMSLELLTDRARLARD